MSSLSPMYDVFVSHAGPDKNTVAIPLYHKLEDQGIRTFVDKEELFIGDDAPGNMTRAMKTATIGVFILSPEFALRPWPMKELNCFLERFDEAEDEADKPTLVPMFYRLSIRECRNKDDLTRNHHAKFGDKDFLDRTLSGDVNLNSIVKSLAEVAKFSGIEREKKDSTEPAEEDEIQRLISKLCELILELKADTESQISNIFSDTVSVGEAFQPAFNAPENDEDVKLSYGHGTVETRILEEVLRQNFASNDTRVVAVTGRAGIGKRCILRSLARHPSVQHRFPDGAYYVHLGQSATIEAVAYDLADAVYCSGGYSSSVRIRSESKLSNILDWTANWFIGKRCMLLVEDLTPGGNLGLSFISDLAEMFSSRTASVLVFSTSCHNPSKADSIVEVCNKGEFADRGKEIFLKYTGLSEEPATELGQKAINELLSYCDGLSVCFRAAGRCIAELLPHFEPSIDFTFQRVVSMVRTVMCSYIPAISGNEYDQVHVISLIYVSLLVLEENRSARVPHKPPLSFMEMFRSISVLKKGAGMTLNFLTRFWQLEGVQQARMIVRAFADVGLFETHMEGHAEDRCEAFRVHDLVQEFANIFAVATDELERWHFCVVCSLLSTSHSEEFDYWQLSTLQGDSLQYMKRLLQESKFSNDEVWPENVETYVFRNLPRHVSSSIHAGLLVDLVLNVSWAQARFEHGGLHALKRDFDLCLGVIRNSTEHSNEERQTLEISISKVRDALVTDWHFLETHPQEFAFQAHTRLLGVAQEDKLVQTYLASLSLSQQGPWLKPLYEFPSSFPTGKPDPPLASELLLDERVLDMVLDKDERNAFVTVGADVLVIDLAAGKITRKFEGHSSIATSVDISPGGDAVISGSWDCTLCIWDISATANEARLFNGHEEGVTGVKFCPCGSRVVSCSADGTLRVWDVDTQTEIFEALRGHKAEVSCLAVSRNGKVVVSGSWDCSIRVWNLQTGTKIGELGYGHEGGIECLAITNDGTKVISGASDYVVKLWDLTNRTEICRIDSNLRVQCLMVLSDDSKVFMGTPRGRIKAWDMTMEGPESYFLSNSYRSEIESLVVLANGDYVLFGCGDGALRVQSTTKRAERRSPASSSEYILDIDDIRRNRYAVEIIKLSPSGTVAVKGESDGQLSFWDVSTGTLLGNAVRDHEAEITDLAFSEDSELLVSGDCDGVIRVWNVATRESFGEPLSDFRGSCQWLELSVDKKCLLAAGRFSMRMWDLESRQALGEEQNLENGWSNIEFTPNDVTVHVYGEDAMCWSWDQRRGLEPIPRSESVEGELVRQRARRQRARRRRPRRRRSRSRSRSRSPEREFARRRNDNSRASQPVLQIGRNEREVLLDGDVIATFPSRVTAWDYKAEHRTLATRRGKVYMEKIV